MTEGLKNLARMQVYGICLKQKLGWLCLLCYQKMQNLISLTVYFISPFSTL